MWQGGEHESIPATAHVGNSTRRSADASTALSSPNHFVPQGSLLQLIFTSFQLFFRNNIIITGMFALLREKTKLGN